MHVHDLVDFVSGEAAVAGKNAANFVKGNIKQADKYININVIDGVRYTVPQKICVNNINDEVPLRFRVDKIYKNAAVVVYFNNEEAKRNKKMIYAPGEMEELVLKKQELIDKNVTEITIKIEQ